MNLPAREIPGVRLTERFDLLWRRCSGDASGSAVTRRHHALFADLAAAYAEPDRRYHTLEHIEHCLRQLDLAADTIDEPASLDLIEMAVWYHDIIYVPSADDNELRSAELFRRLAVDVMEDHMIDDVYRLIMVTVHKTKPEHADEACMVDVDLSSFGMDWSDFHRDSRNVRSEMSHLGDDDFASSQGRFLRNLLERDSIYGTPFFRNLYEAQARKNIEDYLREI